MSKIVRYEYVVVYEYFGEVKVYFESTLLHANTQLEFASIFE